MNIFHFLWRNVMHRKTLSILTALSITLTIALIIVLLQASEGVEQSAQKGYGPFELTLGSKGSQTQLVLNTYYHVGSPGSNIPLQVLHDLKNEQEVAKAFAMTAGDSYNGYPIVGLEPSYFFTRYGDHSLIAGGMYNKTGEAVVGSHVANMLGLHVGDTFHGSHGLVHGSVDSFDTTSDNHEEQHDEPDHEHFEYQIVGILPPLGTADDRAVFTTVDYAWHVHGITHDEDKQITAILVQPKSLLGAQMIKNKYNQRIDVQAVYTSKAVADVVNVVDQGTELVQFVSILCVVLAAISLLLSLTSVVTERNKDVGLMRLIGKSRQYVMVRLNWRRLVLNSNRSDSWLAAWTPRHLLLCKLHIGMERSAC